MKYFECPKCKDIRSAIDWDASTESYYDDSEKPYLVKITDKYIDEAYFYCPSCEKESEGIEIIPRRKKEIT